MTTDAETGCCHYRPRNSQDGGHHQTLRVRQGQTCSEPHGGTNPANTLPLDFRLPELGENRCARSKPQFKSLGNGYGAHALSKYY